MEMGGFQKIAIPPKDHTENKNAKAVIFVRVVSKVFTEIKKFSFRKKCFL